MDAGGEVLNDFSTLAAGGDLSISANSLVNKGIENVATLWFEWATNGQFNRCFGGPCVVIAHGVGEIGWLTAWVVIQPLYENAPDIST
ncbi:hypothetical protein [Rhodospirillum sp. A1_3_36]|uniref:hypothetical protein n=1 Tax=Rhodospirillum sp. A1_3_36 TaxID=3391666 RepID=UPI0039A672B9